MRGHLDRTLVKPENPLVIHFMQYGFTACLQNGPPKDWPVHHVWSPDWKDVTCPGCKAGRALIHTYRIAQDASWIQCLMCGRTSYNQNDVSKHYCGNCHIFHDDLWPPARRSLIREEFRSELEPDRSDAQPVGPSDGSHQDQDSTGREADNV